MSVPRKMGRMRLSQQFELITRERQESPTDATNALSGMRSGSLVNGC